MRNLSRHTVNMSSKKGGDMALINFMVFLMLFLFGLICLLAVLGGPNGYYDEEATRSRNNSS